MDKAVIWTGNGWLINGQANTKAEKAAQDHYEEMREKGECDTKCRNYKLPK